MRHISRFGLALMAGAMVLMPLAVALALPAFDWGIFRQVETASAALHGLSALAALGLMLVAASEPRRLEGAFGGPAMAAAALAVVGLAMLPFADEPLRSLNGTLEHGVGVVWFAELALAIVASTVLRRESPLGFKAAACSAAASGAACAALTVLDLPWGSERFVPYDFPGYLGPWCLLAAVPLVAMPGKAWRAAGVALALAGLYVSGNRSAMLTVPAALALYGMVRVLGPRTGRLALVAAAVALPVALTACVYLAGPAIQARAVAGPPEAGSEAVASDKPVDRRAVQDGALGTVWGRSVTTRLVASSLAERPLRLLTGRGFGSFESVAVERSREAPGRRFVAENETGSRTYWDGDQKARFHSHNLLLEAVLSAGLLAGAAWLAFCGLVARSAPARGGLPAASLLVATLCVAGSFWFLTNTALPLVALAVAAVGPGVRAPALARSPSRASLLAMPAFAALMVALAGLGVFASESARGERMERAFIPLIPGPGGPPCAGFSAVAMPDRQQNTNLYRMLVRRIEDRKSLAVIETGMRSVNIANFSCMMRAYAAEGDTEAMETSLSARARIYKALGDGNPVAERLIAPDFNLWIDDIEKFLDRAPDRTDVVLPFLDWAQSAKRPDRIKAGERLLPRMAESDPVRHYYLAVKAGAEGRADEGAAQMREAMRLGLANLVPVSKETAATPKEASAR